MQQYSLYPGTLIPFKGDFTTIIVNKDNFNDNIGLIQSCIDMFNSEILWDHMFDIKNAEFRVKNGFTMYIGVNETAFGYFWSKPFLSGFFHYNVFVKSDQPIRGKYFMSTVLSNHFDNQPIFLGIDDWNIKSIKMFESIGFVKKPWYYISNTI